MMARSWHLLDLGASSADAHLPPLLISTTFEADSYTIHLTDLTHIWVESLDHAGILERAEDENTSIDPTDSSQLQILLSKLGAALSSGPKTTLNLQIEKNSGRVRPTITLDLTIELPGGLAPLEWPIHLSAAPQSALTSQLTIPLLHEQHARIQETESLKDVLKDKDHVIQKLMDKIEALGVDLGQLFPQATVKSGRKVDRTRAEEKVRGLKPFDTEGDTAQLSRHILIDETRLDLKIESAAGQDNWWETVQDSSIAIYKAGTTRKQTPAKPALKPKESTEDNDGFQVQSTPPHLASKAPKTSKSIALDDSTDDEDLPSQPSRVPDSFPFSQLPAQDSHRKAAKKLSTIGGKKETPKKSSPSSVADDTTDDERPHPKPAKRLGNIGGKKKVERPKSPSPPPSAEEETTDDKDAPAPSPPASTSRPKKGMLGRIGGKKAPPPPSRSPSSSPPPTQAPKRKKGKLGQIGGKKKEPTPTPPASNHSSQEVPASETPTKKKLGLIGGRNKTAHEDSSVVTANEEETRGRTAKVEKEKVQTPLPRETSEERAEKKRRELKRELEEKEKAPVKKKRKF